MSRYGATLLRMALGAVYVAHGAQKLFGLWGGPGLTGTSRMLGQLGFTQTLPLAILVALTEFAGGLLLILGAGTLWAALALLVDMGVATYKVHWPNGFFLNWSVTPGRGHGIEFNVVLIAALLSLALTGPGALSLDDRRHRSRESRAAGRARARKV
jgi:putative oxidoreductase